MKPEENLKRVFWLGCLDGALCRPGAVHTRLWPFVPFNLAAPQHAGLLTAILAAARACGDSAWCTAAVADLLAPGAALWHGALLDRPSLPADPFAAEWCWFSPAGTWACCAYPDEELALIGGTPAFMASLRASVPGLGADGAAWAAVQHDQGALHRYLPLLATLYDAAWLRAHAQLPAASAEESWAIDATAAKAALVAIMPFCEPWAHGPYPWLSERRLLYPYGGIAREPALFAALAALARRERICAYHIGVPGPQGWSDMASRFWAVPFDQPPLDLAALPQLLWLDGLELALAMIQPGVGLLAAAPHVLAELNSALPGFGDQRAAYLRSLSATGRAAAAPMLAWLYGPEGASRLLNTE